MQVLTDFDGRRLENKFFIWIKEVLHCGAWSKGREQGSGLVAAVKTIVLGHVVIGEYEPDSLVALMGREVLHAFSSSAVHTPNTRGRRHTGATREIQVMYLGGECLKLVSIVQGRILLTQLVHAL